MSRYIAGRLGLLGACAASEIMVSRQGRQRARTEEAKAPEPKAPELPLKTEPFVGLFLDAESRRKLAERWPTSAGKRSASYVLLQPRDQLDDASPAVFAPLMGELAFATVSEEATLADATILRARVRLGEDAPVEGIKGHQTCVTWKPEGADRGPSGDVGFSIADAEDGASRPAEFIAVESVELMGTVCRAEYWSDGVCHVPPMTECPLCAYMKASPCRDVFIVWEDCLNACDAKGGDDDTRQERFMTQCAEPTLALKACVEGYPDVFGEMFGSGPPSDDDDDADAEEKE